MTQRINPAPTLTLANGVEMPQLGLGTWPMNDAEAAVTVAAALDMGYRLIDTAENYENERGVGEGIRQSGVARADLFVTTKFNRKWHSVDGARAACEASLERLGLDYIDLLLVHWPNPDQGRYVEAYQGLVRLLEAGLVKSIGTSNFKPAHLQKLFDLGLVPHLNQIQLDPYHLRDDLVDIGAVAAGETIGRRSDDEIIIFGIGGMPVEDVAWGTQIYRNALARGIGTTLNLWQSPAMS